MTVITDERLSSKGIEEDNQDALTSLTPGVFKAPSTNGTSSLSGTDNTRSTGYSGSAKRGLWSRLAKKDDIWDTAPDFGDEYQSCSECFRRVLSRSFQSTKNTLKTAISNPIILLVTLFTFAAIVATGIVLVTIFAHSYREDRIDIAIETAEMTGFEFSKTLAECGRGPLFAMSQFVQNIDLLKALPDGIGQRSDWNENAAPPDSNRPDTHRNITETKCMDQETLWRFNNISKSIKEDADLEGILVNLQVAPMGVLCMFYPLVNSEDFEPPLVMDNRGALGHDLFHDVDRVKGARQTVSSDKPVTVGPLTLKQSQGEAPIVKEAFIMRLAINMTGYLISVPQEDGGNVDYESWGFVVAILNWEEAKKRTGLIESFQNQGMEFHLYRTDMILKEGSTTEFEPKKKTIANSSDWDILNDKNSVSIELETTDNLWVMEVGYRDGFDARFKEPLQAAVVIVAFIFSMMLMTILVVRHDLQLLLYKMMPPQIISRLQRGETIVQRYDCSTLFFSDIVEFTTLSGTLTPIEVMQMLNEMYTAFDALVRKHGIYKVETVGDAYVVIGGGPDKNSGTKGAEKVALFALDAIKFVENFKSPRGDQILIRVGLASGPVVGGVIGTTMPRFSLFGDTVNFAARMESTSKIMSIQCNDLTHFLLCESSEHTFSFTERREGDEVGVFVKGKGHTHTWWINGTMPAKEKAKELPQHEMKYDEDSGE